VVVSHRNLMHNEWMVAEAFGFDPVSAVISWLPLYHDMGLIGSLLQPLLQGSTCTLMSPASFVQRPVRWLRAIAAASGRGVHSGGPNFAYELCLRKIADRELEGLDLSDWKIAFNGAEPVRADVIDAFSDRFASCGFRRSSFLPCYGMAEATLFISGRASVSNPVITAVDSEALNLGRYQPPMAGRPSQRLVSCGQTSGGQTLAVVHPETCVPCAAGEVGELWLSGDSVAQGYWNRPALSQEVFRARLANGDDRTYLRTGDLGFLLDGEVYVTGRIKDLIIVRGCNHYPQDLETTVSDCSEVLVRNGCAAFAVPGRSGEELIVVQEVARVHRANFDAAHTVGQVQRALSEHHQLAAQQIVLIDQAHLPRTSSGKIQRRACKDAMLAGTLRELHRWRGGEANDPTLELDAAAAEVKPTAAEPPSAEEIERWLVARMIAYLRLEVGAIDPREPVAHYGLDSALAVSLIDELSRWLNLELNPMLFWEHPSIEQFSEHVGSLLRA
jgi:acyl-CoA synthetase (AMP-forming)/AMP-acid ligase II/acyl carrier protein